MKIKEWLEGMDYHFLQGNPETDVEEVVYDSRKAKAGVSDLGKWR